MVKVGWLRTVEPTSMIFVKFAYPVEKRLPTFVDGPVAEHPRLLTVVALAQTGKVVAGAVLVAGPTLHHGISAR